MLSDDIYIVNSSPFNIFFIFIFLLHVLAEMLTSKMLYSEEYYNFISNKILKYKDEYNESILSHSFILGGIFLFGSTVLFNHLFDVSFDGKSNKSGISIISNILSELINLLNIFYTICSINIFINHWHFKH